ncbi:MAG: PAS domain S-box protein [Campylobacterales bacterium]|nr:PAS domain S-box protein [Campylobacterales bacterium]
MNFKVLAVDDNENNLFTLTSLLSSIKNLDLIEASSGEEALQITISQNIDLILLDIQMPGIDGFEVAKFLKSRTKTKNIPIVFLTAVFRSEEFFEKGYQVGAVDYLTKPINDNLLLNKIRMYQNLFQKEKEVKKETEKRVESENTFASVFNYAGIGITICNNKAEIQNINQQFTNILGYTKEEAIGKTLFDLTQESDRDFCENRIEELLKNKIPNYSFEKRCLKKDGSLVWVRVNASAVRDENDDVISITTMIYDLTDEKKLSQEKQAKEQLLIRQNRLAEMGEMISQIAHQWRQPLNSLSITIQDFLDAFNYGELDKTYLERNVDSSMEIIRYMSKTIDDFRDFFKPEKEKCPFDIYKAISGASDLVKPQFKSKDISFDITYDKNEDLTFTGFENEFKQAVLNIINNGKDAILEIRKEDPAYHGKILIGIEKLEQQIEISILDNGGGIPKESIEKIFDPYMSTKGKNGTGLGLYMVKTIIENSMNGFISATNKENGALFTITLNLSEKS